MSRKLIINCDDFGQSTAMNQAIMHLLEEGKVSSATMMAVAPGFEEAAAWSARRRQPNIGLHLTLTSEFEALRWGSLTGDASLQDESGCMHKTVREFEQKARTRAVAKELDAQYERVKKAGITISHIDNHMGSLYGVATGRSMLPLMFWKASRWKVPARFFRYIFREDPLLSSLSSIERPVARAAALADVLGVPILDYLLSHPFGLQAGETYDSFKRSIIGKLYRLPSGVSETYFHPGREDSWMMAHIPNWEKRVWEFRLLFDDDLAYAMQDARVELVDYRYVQEKLRRPRIRSGFRLVREFVRK
ncbi:polysaccharide deacetylase family protein [Paenibacillus woosongensis]|uniref:Polysaccharide deacetylase family protein n=1 Tax=Paenibacillus woosongensis TaxID=307580 RepID=A0AA95I8M9_9BACL|nr:polysaccharide deacetylase family protein [Paenibacillus woosongensis]WHX49459.1 polysaccharide deacetylase family protein [Paenibacillus woosongensis]